MNPGQLTKVTYHTDTKEINKYIKFTSIYREILEKVLQNCPYEQAIHEGVRLFWFDDENDEIDINSQESLEIYETCTLGVERRRLHVDAVKADGKSEKGDKASTKPTVNQPEIPPAAGSYEFAVHDNVECDACLMAPIIGFRYKCIQCLNYDLCQNCESKHTHSEHMMVRMPTNNCPSVVETYITGRSSGRKHGKRAKTSYPFVKNGLSVVIDDDGEGSQAVGGGGGEGSEQAMPSNGKERHHGRRHHRRHQRHSFLQNLYEMMHDLAEGGGAAAAAHAMGEDEEPPACSTKTTTSTTGPHTKTTTQSTCNDKNFEENISNVHVAAQQAHEAAMKAAEIAAKVAHETAVQAAKSISESMSAAPSAPTTDAQSNTTSTGMNNKNKTDKVDATTSPRMANTSVPSTPSLEALTQFLDPQYMKTGIQILNNFSDMFAKMLDPLDNEVGSGTNKATSPPCSFNTTNLRKNSTASSKSTVSSQQNSINSEKKFENEKPTEKQQNSIEEEEAIKELNKQTESDVSSHVGIEDLGSDSENDSDSFIKLDAPQEASFNKSGTTTANVSAQTTPPQSLNKSNVMDFAQLTADLKAHIAEEARKNTGTSVETGVAITEQVKPNTTDNTNEPVVSTTAATPTNQERRAVPVYHANERINNAVLAMMAMGFSNEGAWLTQLLESVDGNIDEALELMPVAPRGGR